jgi:hypothetical protein
MYMLKFNIINTQINFIYNLDFIGSREAIISKLASWFPEVVFTDLKAKLNVEAILNSSL